jgi:hypothetical protein
MVIIPVELPPIEELLVIHSHFLNFLDFVIFLILIMFIDYLNQ